MKAHKQRRRKKKSRWTRRLRPVGQTLAALPGKMRASARRLRRRVTSRSFRAALLCLPALLTIAVVTWGGLVSHETAMRTVARYRQAGQTAVEAKDAELAALYFHKLLYLDESEPQARYGLALLADARGDTQPAERLMQQLAPTPDSGYAPAQFWLAQQRIRRSSTEQRPLPVQDVELLQKRLSYVVAQEPRHMEARRLLGQLCIDTGRVTEAVTHLAVAAEDQPSLHLTLIQLGTVLGNRTVREFHGKAAREYFQRQLAAKPQDTEAELGLAAAELSLGNATRAIDLLQDGMTRTDDPRFQLGLTSGYLAIFDQTDPRDIARRLELIERAWRHGPDNAAVLTRVQQLAASSGPEAERARKTIERSLEMGKAPALAHFLLGAMDFGAGELTAARSHFEEAHRLDPTSAQTANNLAWLLSNSEPLDLSRALLLVTAVVRSFPAQANFRETRGQILVKLGRYQEAVTDLEMALAALPGTPAIHEALAKAYDALGDKELAARHREHAKISQPAKTQ